MGFKHRITPKGRDSFVRIKEGVKGIKRIYFSLIKLYDINIGSNKDKDSELEARVKKTIKKHDIDPPKL